MRLAAKPKITAAIFCFLVFLLPIVHSAKGGSPSLLALTDDVSVDAIAVYELTRAGDPNFYTDVYYSFYGHKPKYPAPFNNITEWKWWTLLGEGVPTAPLPNGFGADNNRPSIAFSREGYAVAVWDNYAFDSFIPCGFPFPVPAPRNRGHILYSIWNGTEWSPAAIAVQGGPDIIASDPGIAIDSNGNGLLLFSVLEQTRVIGCPFDTVLSVNYTKFFGSNRTFDQPVGIEGIPNSPFEPMFSTEIGFSSGLVGAGAHTRHHGVAAWWRPAGTSSRVCPGDPPFTATVDTYWPRKAIWNGNVFEQIEWIPERMVPDPLLLNNQSTVMGQKLGISSDQFNHTMVVWEVFRQYYAAPSDPCGTGGPSGSREVWAARWNSSAWSPTAASFAIRATDLSGLDVAYVPENEAVAVYSDWFAGQPEVRWSRFRTDKTWQNRGRLDANNGGLPSVASVAHNRTMAIWTAGTPSNILWSVIENKDIAAGAWAAQSVLAPGTNQPDLAAHTGSPTLPPAEWTVALYQAADHNLWRWEGMDGGTIENDTGEELAQVGSTNLVNIVALFDRFNNFTDGLLAYSKLGGLTRLETLGNINTADPVVLANFTTHVLERYPAERVMLVLSDHGMGWIGACADSHPATPMLNLTELREGITKANYHYDILGFNACLMAMLEAMHELQNISRYYVASQDVETGQAGAHGGWPFHTILADFTAWPNNESRNFSSAIVTRYDRHWDPAFARRTMSAVDMARIPRLVDSVRAYGQISKASMNASEAARLVAAAILTQGYVVGHFRDIRDYAVKVQAEAQLRPEIKAAAAAMAADVGAAVINEAHGPTNANSHGISLWIPVRRLAEVGPLNASYNQTRFNKDASWDEYLLNVTGSSYHKAVLQSADHLLYHSVTDPLGAICGIDPASDNYCQGLESSLDGCSYVDLPHEKTLSVPFNTSTFTWRVDGRHLVQSAGFVLAIQTVENGTITAEEIHSGVVSPGGAVFGQFPGASENSPPVLISIGNRTIPENQTLVIDLEANDPDNQSVLFGTDAAEILPSPFTFDSQTGLFNWTPGFNESGTYAVAFNVTDGQLSDSETVSIVVSNANRPPLISSVGNRSVSENQTLVMDFDATDPDGDPVTFTTNAASVLPSPFSFDSATGVFAWTPTFTDAGAYEVSFGASDNESTSETSALILVGNVQPFSPEIRVTFGAAPSELPVLATDPLDAAHIAWTLGGEYAVYWIKLKNGMNASNMTRETFPPAAAFNPSMATDSAGNVLLAWEDFRDGPFFLGEVYYKTLNNNGTPVTGDIRASVNLNNSRHPVVAAGPNGSVHLAWDDNRSGNYEIFYRRLSTSGDLLSPEVRLTEDPSPSEFPAAMTDPAGNVHIAWVDGRYGGTEILYKKLSPNGTNLTGDIRLTSDLATSYQPTLGTDPQGNVHVVWSDGRNLVATELYYTKLNNAGVNVSPELRVSDSPGQPSWQPSLTVDRQGRLHVSWIDYRDGRAELYYMKLANDGSSVVDDLRLTNDPSARSSPSIGADSQNNAHIAWFDYRHAVPEIYYLVSVNLPPFLAAPANLSVQEGRTLLLDVNASDPNEDALVYFTNASGILPSPFTFDNATGLLNWTPTFADNGTYTIGFAASDGVSAHGRQVTITVIDVLPRRRGGSPYFRKQVQEFTQP